MSLDPVAWKMAVKFVILNHIDNERTSGQRKPTEPDVGGKVETDGPFDLADGKGQTNPNSIQWSPGMVGKPDPFQDSLLA